MRRIVAVMFVVLIFAACTHAPGNGLAGKWRIVEKGVDQSGTPCPFIADDMEFFRDGTVSMSNLPKGQKLLYTTDITPQDRAMLEKRFPVLRGKGILALLPPAMDPSRINWKLAPVPFSYQIDRNTLVIEANGWSPSRYKRVR